MAIIAIMTKGEYDISLFRLSFKIIDMNLYLITIKNGAYAIGASESKEYAIEFAKEETARKYRPIDVEYMGKIIWSNH